MKYNRGTKCHFGKYITKKKQAEIDEVLAEYARVGNHFINKYGENFKEELPKKTSIKAAHYQVIAKETNTFLLPSFVFLACYEAYGMLQSAKTNQENRLKKAERLKGKLNRKGEPISVDTNFYKPVMYGNKITLSNNVYVSVELSHLQNFDLVVTFKGFRGDKGKGYKILIPIKKHKVYNKWNNIGRLCTGVVLKRDSLQFCFEAESGPKKEDGVVLGIDFGLKRLATLSDGTVIGPDLWKYLIKIASKVQGSSAYYHAKEEAKTYINTELNKFFASRPDVKMLVMERDIASIKYKMKEYGRLSQKMRHVLSCMTMSLYSEGIARRCEENRVSFRTVDARYTSQTCSVCGHREKANRPTQESFLCQNCGHSDNADINAAKVILGRLPQEPTVPDAKSCTFTTK